MANDILITGGQVVDPARGFDAMDNVSIHAATIRAGRLVFRQLNF